MVGIVADGLGLDLGRGDVVLAHDRVHETDAAAAIALRGRPEANLPDRQEAVPDPGLDLVVDHVQASAVQ